MDETPKQVELDYNKTENQPKKIIGVLEQQMLARSASFTKDDWLKVAGIISDSLQNKDVQIAFSNADEEQLAERYGWNGRIKPTIGDSLAVNFANIGGQKTDGVIDESVDQQVHIDQTGSIQDDVTIHRVHNGIKGTVFSGVRNVGYLRIYVPKGSTVTAASGFDKPEAKWFQPVDDTATPDPDVQAIESTSKPGPDGTDIMVEGDRTVIGGWLQLDPGQSQDIKVSYGLPFTTSDILSKMHRALHRVQAVRICHCLLANQENRTDISRPRSRCRRTGISLGHGVRARMTASDIPAIGIGTWRWLP